MYTQNPAGFVHRRDLKKAGLPWGIFPNIHFSSCSHAQKAKFWTRSLGVMGSSGSSVLSFLGLQVGDWLPLTHLCVT